MIFESLDNTIGKLAHFGDFFPDDPKGNFAFDGQMGMGLAPGPRTLLSRER